MAIDQILEQNINDCLKVINNEKTSTRGTGKIYRNTNEILATILQKEDIEGKDVLSVMASSDQVFSSYYLGAKSVDTFDSNILTYYYFFLKKWTVLCTKKHYISANNKDLEKCIDYHNDTEEEIRAYIFWKEVLKQLKDSLYYSELFYKGSIWWNTPYQNDMETLCDIIQNIKPNYTNLNIFKPIEIKKQYDVIILSNILEYLYDEDDFEYYEYSRIVIENLRKLLKPNGIAISSNILDYDYKGNRLFEQYFEFKNGKEGLSIRHNCNIPLSYTYKKKQ